MVDVNFKDIIALLLLLGIYSTACAQSAVQPSGLGTGASPLEIDSLPNLNWLSQYSSAWNDTIIQTSNIDASDTKTWNNGNGFTPIGNHAINFNGVYHGKGHTIQGLWISETATNDLGLFGYTGLNSIIDSLGLLKVKVNSSNGAGTIGIGAIVGQNLGDISNSFATGIVSGGVNVGGLVGINWGVISNAYANDSILGNSFIGGITGLNNGRISSSYASGIIIGGIRSRTVGNSTIGGLAGENKWKIESCFWDTNTTSLVIPIGDYPYNSTSVVTDAYGLSDSGMRDINSFIAWDFNLIWFINPSKSYPLLKAFTNIYTKEDLGEVSSSSGSISSNAMSSINTQISSVSISSSSTMSSTGSQNSSLALLTSSSMTAISKSSSAGVSSSSSYATSLNDKQISTKNGTLKYSNGNLLVVAKYGALSVYNMLGIQVKSLTIKESGLYPLSLKNGIYIVQHNEESIRIIVNE